MERNRLSKKDTIEDSIKKLDMRLISKCQTNNHTNVTEVVLEVCGLFMAKKIQQIKNHKLST